MATAKKTAAAPLPPSAMPMGALIDGMWDLREQKRALEAQVKEIEARFEELQTALMDRMGAEKTEKGAGTRASVSITSSIVGQLADYEELCKFIKKTGHFQLFERRISAPAYRELYDLKGAKAVPGVAPFTKVRVNLTTLKS